MPVDNHTRGYSLAIASSSTAAVATVLGKWILLSTSPLTLNAVGFSVAGVVLMTWLLPRHGIKSVFNHSRAAWGWILAFSISSWAGIWAFWTGVQKMEPSLAAFLNRAEVFIAIILAIIFLKERFNRFELLGAVLSIGGIVVMKMTLRFEYSVGFWFILLGSLFYGITELVSKIAVRYVSPSILAGLRNSMLAVFYWITWWFSDSSFEGLSEVWYGVLALGIVGPILSRMVYLMALKRLELSKVAVVSQSQPLFVIVIALLAFGQLPTIREYLGGILLSAGCLTMILYRKPLANTIAKS